MSARKKIVVLGMVTRHPVAGMVWLTMQVLRDDAVYTARAKPPQ